MEVLPSINCAYKDFDCVREKMRIAETLGAWAHLDVADGRYTFNKSWGEPEEWATLKTGINLEVHLMVEEPEKYVADWLRAGAKRIVVQAEIITTDTSDQIITLANDYNAQVMLSFAPETRVDSVPFLEKFSDFQILSVHPGPSAQAFLPLTMEKVKFLRHKFPNARIEVDGGVNLETGKLAKKAGADMLVSGSYIFGNSNPQSTYQALTQI